MRTSSELITVASFETAPEAWIYQNRLEANGITAFVADEHVANAYWLYSTAIGGVKVQIPDREIKSFRRFEVLEATTTPAPLPCFEEQSFEDQSYVGDPCPQCSSHEISFQRWPKRTIFAIWLVLGVVIPIYSPSQLCNQCGLVTREQIDIPTQFNIIHLVILLS